MITRSHHAVPARPGFTLWEMLIALILMSVAGLMVARVFRSSLLVIRDAPAAQDRMHRDRIIFARLRRDVWQAQRVERVSNRELELADVATPGQRIRWTIADDGTLTRSEGAAADKAPPATTWAGAGRDLSFAPSPAGAVVRFSGRAPTDAPSDVLLCVQASLVNGGRS